MVKNGNRQVPGHARCAAADRRSGGCRRNHRIRGARHPAYRPFHCRTRLSADHPLLCRHGSTSAGVCRCGCADGQSSFRDAGRRNYGNDRRSLLPLFSTARRERAVTMNTTRKIISVSLILLITIIAVFLVSLNMGTMKIPLAEVVKAFSGTGSEQNYTVLMHFRLPRMVIAILIGAGIAVSGAILQSVSRNALADQAFSASTPGLDWPSYCIFLFSRQLVQFRHMVRLYHAFCRASRCISCRLPHLFAGLEARRHANPAGACGDRHQCGLRGADYRIPADDGP